MTDGPHKSCDWRFKILTEGPKYVNGMLTTVVNVAVGSPAALVASDVESDSHGGNSCVGAVMKGGQTDTDSKKVVNRTGARKCRNRCGRGAEGFGANEECEKKKEEATEKERSCTNREKGGEEGRLCGRNGKGVQLNSLVFNFPIKTT